MTNATDRSDTPTDEKDRPSMIGWVGAAWRTLRSKDTSAPTAPKGPFPRAFALPAAIHRLAAQASLGSDTDGAALTEEYGPEPGRESLTMLGEALGTNLAVDKVEVANLRADQLPLIAVAKSGGAVLLRSRHGDQFVVEGEVDTHTVDLDAVDAALTGTVLAADLGEAAAEKLAPAYQKWIAPIQDLAEKGAILRWLTRALWQQSRPAFTQLVAAAVISNLFLIALPLFIMSVYDRVIPHAAFESLQTLAMGIGIVLVADLGLRYAKLKFVDAIGLNISQRLQINLYRRLLRVQLSRKPRSASVITNVQTELETLCLLLPEFLCAVIADTLFVVVVLALIASMGGVVVLAPITGMLIVAAIIATGAIKARRGAQQAVMLRTAASTQVTETFDSLTTVKAVGAEHQLLKRFERLGELNAVKGHSTRQHLRFASNAAGVMVQATVVGTLCLGVMRIDAGLMTIGSLAAITILVGRAVMPVGQLVDQFCRLWTLKDVVSATFDLVTETEEQGGEADGGASRAFHGHIALRHASFRYESAQVDALKGVTLTIKPGEKIGIVGKNGSGKSTLLHLLPRLLLPTDGTMLIDDHDARQFSPHRLRQDIGFMPQETVLFNQSLKDNICLGSDQHTDEDFQRAVSLSGVDRFARAHPEGYSMQVGPRGEFLSAGERQAVGLARALLTPKKVLVMDEPTSLFDHTAEGQVIAALAKNLGDTALIVTTHRLRLLELVDRVITLDQGRIIADGPKNEVLASLTGQQANGTRRSA